jgi:hypothetical protein
MISKWFLFLAVASVGFNSALIAQELQIDTKALDTSGSVSEHPAKNKKIKAAPKAEAQSNTGAGGQLGNVANRQFGELEGWSPGKEPPPSKYAVKKHDDAANSGPSGGNAIKPSMRPTGMTGGNVGMGMSF